MKILRIIRKFRDVSEEDIKDFIYRNMSQEMINGLEYDDPTTIKRALKLFGIDKNAEDTPSGSSGDISKSPPEAMA